MLEAFNLTHAKSIDDAIDLKNKLGEDATYYAGGTELLQVLKEGMLSYNHLINLKSIPEMAQIELDKENGVLRIGALVTHDEIASSEVVRNYQPALAKLEDYIGNIRIRKSGTIGGNLAFAEPRSDPGAYLVAAEGIVCTISPSNSRKIPMTEFWQGPFETALEEDEIITAIEVPIVEKLMGTNYRKFTIGEYPMVGVAVVLKVDDKKEKIVDSRLVISAANPIPTRLISAEELLHGETIDSILNKDIKWWITAIEPVMDAVDDIEGSAEYKIHVAGSLLFDAVSDVIGELKGVEVK